jgi:hypothetical protein
LSAAPDAEANQAGLADFSAAHVFRPSWRDGAGPAALGAGVALVLALALIVRGVIRGVSFASFAAYVDAAVLLCLASLFAYWAYAIYNLRYAVDDDALIIVWGWTRHVIPVDQVHRIVLGRRLGKPRIDGISWRGCHVGRGRVERFGEVQFYSAHRTVTDLVYLTTPSATFGISLTDARGLARSILAAQERIGATGARTVLYRPSPAQSFLGDTGALVLTGGILFAFLIAAGYIASRYQGMPTHISFSYPPGYGPERIGPRAELLRLPLTALVWLVAGMSISVWAHAKVRAVSFVVLFGTLFAECLYAVASVAAAH